MSDLEGDSAPIDGANALTRNLQRLSPLGPDDRLALEALVRSAEWIAPGARIANEGEPDGATRPLLDGLACRYKDFRDGRRQVIALLLPGDICVGYGHPPGRMDHGVRALTRVRIATIPAHRFAELVDRHPAIAAGFRKAALIEQAILRAWVVNLGQRDARERMAHLFCELERRMKDHGLLLSDGGFALPLTQQELGAALGLTSVHVNRVLQRLRNEALIDLDHGFLRIQDLRRLQSLADFDPTYLGI